jgi:hypothetical protein
VWHCACRLVDVVVEIGVLVPPQGRLQIVDLVKLEQQREDALRQLIGRMKNNPLSRAGKLQ